MTGCNRQARRELFDAARECLRTERRRVIDEREAFAAFERRIRGLDAYRARLLVLEEQCRDTVDRRQAALVEQRRSLSLPVEGPGRLGSTRRKLTLPPPDVTIYFIKFQYIRELK